MARFLNPRNPFAVPDVDKVAIEFTEDEIQALLVLVWEKRQENFDNPLYAGLDQALTDAQGHIIDRRFARILREREAASR